MGKIAGMILEETIGQVKVFIEVLDAAGPGGSAGTGTMGVL